MKKFIATVICLVALVAAAIPVDAQTRRRSYDNRSAQSRYDYRNTRYNRGNTNYDPRYDRNRNDRDHNGYYGDDRSVWEKHRDKITTAGGAVAGAVLGGLVGGKKGAIIGAIAGGGGAAVYTYKIRDKGRQY